MKIKIKEMPLSLSWIAAVTGGELILAKGETMPLLRHICTDSREADAETLFCAIPGERVDGFDYIPAAMGQGCGAVLCQKRPAQDISAVLVCDTIAAMGKLAEAYKNAYMPELFIVGVTGSVGKTTTKECIAAVLSAGEPLFKKEGNYNSTIGLPLSVMEMSRANSAAVLEMGMSGFGEIEAMSRILHPTVGCIINIGTSHMEHLGSREGIAKAKMEIIQGMPERSTLLINGDEPLLEPVRSLCREKYITCLRLSLSDPSAELYADNVTVGQGLMRFDLHTPKGALTALEIPAVGQHMVWAAAFAAAVGVLRGMSFETVRAGLRNYRPAGMRQNITEQNGVTLIEDCYNAAPESMAAALSVLKLTAKGRMIAVLGDMKELGADTVSLHRTVGERVADLAKEGREVHLVTVGELGAEIAAGASRELPADSIFIGHGVAPYEDTVRYLKSLLREGDTVLFKASRAMTLETIADALK